MLELEHGFRVVDANARLDPDADEVEAFGRETTPERLEREMHQSGVVQAVVSPGRREGTAGYLQANNAVARLGVDRPFLAFARLAGPRSVGDGASARVRNLAASRKPHHTDPEDVEQYAYDDRFHGFTLAPADDGLPDAGTLAVLDDVGLPVLVHAGESFPPAEVAATLLDHSFPVVLTSFGGFPLNRELMHESVDLLARHDQLYLDSSFVRFRDPLERGLLEHPDRVVFGSGAPDTHPSVAVMEILTLDVSEDALRRAFSKNLARVVPALAPGDE
jgi:hypothetical protein